MFRWTLSIAVGFIVASQLMNSEVRAADAGGYDIVVIKRDVGSGKDARTVNGTMMLDRDSGRSWILDEQKGRWVPVGYLTAKPASGVALTPGTLSK